METFQGLELFCVLLPAEMVASEINIYGLLKNRTENSALAIPLSYVAFGNLFFPLRPFSEIYLFDVLSLELD